jgi:ceramide glucosyltransferase
MISGSLALLAVIGIIQAIGGCLLMRAFVRRPRAAPLHRPPVTILKPVCGDEPLLEQALASFCTQDYPDIQIIIGTHSAADPAIEVAYRLQAKYPDRDIAVVVDPTQHGINRKIGNIINMMPLAKHEILISADSDLHVAPDYVDRVVAALERPDCGLVTTLYAAEAAVAGAAARLGAMHLNHTFLPGALLATRLGRQDCLGTTMALRRATLESAGGLRALVSHVADDYLLGRLVRKAGLSVELAETVPVTTVQERGFHGLWLHELRWARTIAAIEPFAMVGATLQHPIFWSVLAVIASAGAGWAWACFALAWLARAAAAVLIDRSLNQIAARHSRPAPLWLLPLRDLMSVATIVASFAGSRVIWRGNMLRAGNVAGIALGAAGRGAESAELSPEQT